MPPLAACPLVRLVVDYATADGWCYEVVASRVVPVHPHAACPLRAVDAALPALAAGAGVAEYTPTLLFETLGDLRRLTLHEQTPAHEHGVPLAWFTGGCADDAAPPFERRFVSPAVGDGLFTRPGAALPPRFLLGEYAGVVRSEAGLPAGEGVTADGYRAAYPAVDGAGSLFITGRTTGGWMRLVNHAPAAAGGGGGGAGTGAAAAEDAGRATSCDGSGDGDDPSRWVANCAFVITWAAGIPRLVLATTRAVPGGTQLLADYGPEYTAKFFGAPRGR